MEAERGRCSEIAAQPVGELGVGVRGAQLLGDRGREIGAPEPRVERQIELGLAPAASERQVEPRALHGELRLGDLRRRAIAREHRERVPRRGGGERIVLRRAHPGQGVGRQRQPAGQLAGHGVTRALGGL